MFKKHFVFKLSIAALPLFSLRLVFSRVGFTTQGLKWSVRCALVSQLTQAWAGTAHWVSASALQGFCNHVAAGVMAKSGDCTVETSVTKRNTSPAGCLQEAPEHKLYVFLCISEHLWYFRSIETISLIKMTR